VPSRPSSAPPAARCPPAPLTNREAPITSPRLADDKEHHRLSSSPSQQARLKPLVSGVSGTTAGYSKGSLPPLLPDSGRSKERGSKDNNTPILSSCSTAVDEEQAVAPTQLDNVGSFDPSKGDDGDSPRSAGSYDDDDFDADQSETSLRSPQQSALRHESHGPEPVRYEDFVRRSIAGSESRSPGSVAHVCGILSPSSAELHD
jgi:hypothetical protein